MVRQKRRRWACADCGSTINDESMREVGYSPIGTTVVHARYVEFCDVCSVYNPEVVMKYD